MSNAGLHIHFTTTCAEVIVNTPGEFAVKLRSEIERYRRNMAAAGVRPQKKGETT